MKEDEIDDISEKIDDASTGAEAHSTYVVPKEASICRECSKTGFSTMRHT